CEDQVNIEPMDSRISREIKTAWDVVRLMMPLQDREFSSIKTLRSHADSIDAHISQHPAIISIDRCRIYLSRPFGTFAEFEPISEPLDQALHLFDGKKGGRSAAKEHGAGPYCGGLPDLPLISLTQ